ncbi:hypothetical protein [Cryptosporangium japonicum]|uniref:Uncharacterized protein n=1 Tax=Cryptosporangium japonicum TaxID=80872 RepID=A0ABP3ERP2_9ACTN
MEYIAAYFIARDADQQRMSAGRLDGPVAAPRPSLWRRAARSLARTASTRRAPASKAPVTKVPAAKAPAAGQAGCATA